MSLSKMVFPQNGRFNSPKHGYVNGNKTPDENFKSNVVYNLKQLLTHNYPNLFDDLKEGIVIPFDKEYNYKYANKDGELKMSEGKKTKGRLGQFLILGDYRAKSAWIEAPTNFTENEKYPRLSLFLSALYHYLDGKLLVEITKQNGNPNNKALLQISDKVERKLEQIVILQPYLISEFTAFFDELKNKVDVVNEEKSEKVIDETKAEVETDIIVTPSDKHTHSLKDEILKLILSIVNSEKFDYDNELQMTFWDYKRLKNWLNELKIAMSSCTFSFEFSFKNALLCFAVRPHANIEHTIMYGFSEDINIFTRYLNHYFFVGDFIETNPIDTFDIENQIIQLLGIIPNDTMIVSKSNLKNLLKALDADCNFIKMIYENKLFLKIDDEGKEFVTLSFCPATIDVETTTFDKIVFVGQANTNAYVDKEECNEILNDDYVDLVETSTVLGRVVLRSIYLTFKQNGKMVEVDLNGSDPLGVFVDGKFNAQFCFKGTVQISNDGGKIKIISVLE